MAYATQPGMTPPVPGQDKEEPELWQEDDIPVDQEPPNAEFAPGTQGTHGTAGS